jgi:hypothetical protein
MTRQMTIFYLGEQLRSYAISYAFDNDVTDNVIRNYHRNE